VLAVLRDHGETASVIGETTAATSAERVTYRGSLELSL